jgi:hypothetical protein
MSLHIPFIFRLSDWQKLFPKALTFCQMRKGAASAPLLWGVSVTFDVTIAQD